MRASLDGPGPRLYDAPLHAGREGRPVGFTRTGFFMENVFNLPQSIPQILRQGQTDARELATLLEIGQTLADASHLRPAIARTLELLGPSQGVARGFVMLFEPEANELRVEAGYMLDEEAARRVGYRVGEGVVGRVAETCRAVVVPRAGREPLMLQRVAGRERAASRQ